MLLHSMPYDSLDQVVGNGLVERKLEIALLSPVPRDRFPQLFVSSHRRIQPDVLLKGGVVDEVAIQGERRNSIADLLLRLGSGFPDRGPDLLQDRLNLRWERRDVFIGVLGVPNDRSWCASYCPGGPTDSDVLIDEDWIAIRIHHDKACRPLRALLAPSTGAAARAHP